MQNGQMVGIVDSRGRCPPFVRIIGKPHNMVYTHALLESGCGQAHDELDDLYLVIPTQAICAIPRFSA